MTNPWDKDPIDAPWAGDPIDQPDPQVAEPSRGAMTRATGWQQTPGKDPGMLTEFLGGAKHAWDRAAYGLAEVLNPGTMGNDSPLFPSTAQRKRELQEGGQFVKETGPASTVGQIAGDVAMSAPVALKVFKGLNAARGLIPAIAGETAVNAGYGALTADENEAGQGAAMGAVGTVAGHGLARAVQGLNRPISKEAKLLREAGVPLTAGQLYGGGLNKLERAVAKVPYAGAALRDRLDESMKGFQQASRNAVEPGAESLDKLNKSLTDAYTNALGQAKFQPGARFILDPEELVKRGSNGNLQAPKATVDQAMQVVGDVMSNVTAPDPHMFHWAEKRLKSIAFDYKASPDPAQREFGNLIYDAAKTLRDDWRSKLLGNTGEALAKVDAAYSKFVPIRGAASKGVGTLEAPEAYTPRMLLQAIRQGDKTPTKSGFMAGKLPQQELAAAAENVIGSRAANPDITSNILSAGAIPAALMTGTGAHGLAAAIGLPLYGSKTTQKALTSAPAEKLITGQLALQQALAAALRRTGTATLAKPNDNDQ